MIRWRQLPVLAALLLAAGITPASAAGRPPPQIAHTVVVVEENHGLADILAKRLPFIDQLIAGGALMTQSYAVAHPSEPNYLALFSGATWGVADDAVHNLEGINLATALRATGKSFIGYAEAGSPRKHEPWDSFADAASTGRAIDDFPDDFDRLPTVAFVIPNDSHDMHSGSLEIADQWLSHNLGGYARWCLSHDGLLVLTFDEDDHQSGNHILTLFYGKSVRPGRYAARIDHYTLLRTLAAIAGIAPPGESARREPITEIWTE